MSCRRTIWNVSTFTTEFPIVSDNYRARVQHLTVRHIRGTRRKVSNIKSPADSATLYSMKIRQIPSNPTQTNRSTSPSITEISIRTSIQFPSFNCRHRSSKIRASTIADHRNRSKKAKRFRKRWSMKKRTTKLSSGNRISSETSRANFARRNSPAAMNWNDTRKSTAARNHYRVRIVINASCGQTIGRHTSGRTRARNRIVVITAQNDLHDQTRNCDTRASIWRRNRRKRSLMK